MWGEVRGHHRQRELFENAFRRDRLAHAYLFIGPEGIGKGRFAEALAMSLFCEQRGPRELKTCGTCASCRQVRANTHPDLIRLSLPQGKRELPVELIIGSRDSRGREGLCHELAMRPMRADRRIAVVDDAQTMNAESANALLKTLEEPPPGSVLILLAPSVDALLPTIRSRCQPVHFMPLSDTDVADLLLSMHWAKDAKSAREVAELSGGSLQTAQQLLQPELHKLRAEIVEFLRNESIDPFIVSRAILATIDELGGDPATQRDHAAWAVRFCVEALRNRLRDLSTHDEPDGQSRIADEIDSLAVQMERCFDAENQLQRSMPIPLCLEGLFDQLGRIRRGKLSV